jgi:hypothetical protein
LRTLAISCAVSPRAPDNAIAMAVPTEKGESTILPDLPESSWNSASPLAL